ncbi:YqgQ family protein [Lactobacillus sp. Sy-1]|uniref:YqgQ family protein n=1 Tax=Lactobacillus sp. Sy-1 TaxID=2109645 RepID=UPI001C577E2B|nr:YqgQ family protein [Lactobacillus sp. Sy-1]MBW1605667.1 YqgQ family protein [Lactobacillus sp. Sy-1]
MKTLYDVQQLLKKFGIYVYVGKRLWDIEVMALELDHLHDAHVVSDKAFISAKLVLNHEHKIEERKEAKKHDLGGI